MEGIMEHYIDGKTIALFTEKLTELERSSLTVSKYVRDVSTFRRWLGSGGCVDKSKVIRFKQILRDKYRLTSANSMLSALNKFFQLMGWEDCRIRTFKIQRASFRNEERELSVEEYRRLLNAAKEKGDLQILSIMETIASTGIRISELQFITVASVSTRRALVSLKGKSRQVLIPAELCKKLRRYCRERKITSGSIFVTRTGKPIDRSNILHRMKALSNAANVNREKIFPHNLRHFFAVNYYRTEKDIVRLADLLGHANINTTRIYTLISCGSQLDILDKVEKSLQAV
jgi:site-specific recombinase XerD